MMRALVSVICAASALGIAATAFAIHAEIPSETQAVVAKGQTQVTIGGDLRFRGETRHNTINANDEVVEHTAYYNTRVRLSVEAKVTPNTIGKVALESGDEDSDDDRWGCGSSASDRCDAKGTYTQGNSKAGPMTIREAWLQHSGSGLFGVPALVRVGHMLITIGKGLFYNHSKFGDDAILFGVDPTKNMHVILFDAKASERDTARADDADVYSLLFNYEFDKNSALGIDVTYLNDQKFTVAAPTGSIPAVIGAVHLWNIGANGKAVLGPFDLYGEIVLQTGSLADVPGNHDPKFKGYAGVIGGHVTLAPVKLNLELAYGSGKEASDNDVKTFVTSQNDTQHYTYVYEHRTVNAANELHGGIQNTWYVKADAHVDITKDLNAQLSLYYLRAVKKIDSATVGGANVNNYGFPSTSNSKDIGFEIDGYIGYRLSSNLIYYIEGGYLFSGNFWTAIAKDEPEDVFAIRNGIQLTF